MVCKKESFDYEKQIDAGTAIGTPSTTHCAPPSPWSPHHGF